MMQRQFILLLLIPAIFMQPSSKKLCIKMWILSFMSMRRREMIFNYTLTGSLHTIIARKILLTGKKKYIQAVIFLKR